MKPTVGRIVHYTNVGDADGKYPPEQQAAIITRVKKREYMDHDDERVYEMRPNPSHYDVSLHIFYSTGNFFMEKVPFSAQYKRGYWTWPVRS